MRPFLLPTLGTFLLFLMSFYTHSQTMPGILTERARAEAVDAILEDRFENLLPQLMRRDGLDM